ncbi:MAG: hypothetical protein VYE77_00655 [Planctomycetota bacterium]|nr:hypothetical protein [Planctomycetota bacterium]
MPTQTPVALVSGARSQVSARRAAGSLPAVDPAMVIVLISALATFS